ncbi:Fc receptor-like protein 6 [Lithobates pipiens]
MDLFSSPEVNKTPYPVTQGDNLILTCDTVLSPLRQETELHFAFYKDGQYVQRFSSSNQYEVQSAQLEDIGKYSCEVKTSSSTVRKMSKAIHVQIQELFQTTEIRLTSYPLVEGDNMTLMCFTSLSPLKQTTELQFAFYKEGRSVQRFSSSNQHGDCCAQLEDSGNYSCEVKALNNNIKKTSKELYVVTQELFSKPYITAILYPTVEEDHMALLCNTSLSPIRQETELQFAFYRDGRDVQGFGPSDQYEVHSAQLEESGNYSCEVRTSANSVKKRSEEINIHFQGTTYRRYELMNITRLVAAFLIYVACCFITFKYC